MSVSRKKQPILLISFQIDKPYKPTMTIYEDSDVDVLIRQFIKTHQLKSTAYNIIKRVVDQNLQELREQQRQHRKKSSRQANKENQRTTETKNQQKNKHQRQTSETKQKLTKPPQLDSNAQLRLQLKPSQTEIQSVMQKQSKLRQAGLTDLQQQFQRQFKEVKTSRYLSHCQPQLMRLYERLTCRNPTGCPYIDPDYIDFSSFQVNLLDCLEQFFSLLDQQDFQRLDYDKFRKLLTKHQCLKLVQFLRS